MLGDVEAHAKIAKLEAEIARLQELLRGTGANRYWEERWRDADAENQRLRASLEEMSTYPVAGDAMVMLDIALKALAKEGE